MADIQQLDLCYSNLSEAFIIIAGVSRVFSGVSLLVCLFVMATILLTKKYNTSTLRLNLYLCIVAALHSIATVTGAAAYFPMQDSSYSYSAYCVWSGFTYQQTLWMVLTTFLVIFVDIYIRVAWQKETTRFEKLYVLIIFIFPLFFNWIPFIDSTYGPVGPWCWIRTINFDDKCSIHIQGIAWQAFLAYIPLTILCVAVIVLYILMIHAIYRKNHARAHTHDSRRDALKEARPILIYPWVLFIVLLISIVNRIASGVTSDQPTILVLYCLSAAATSLQSGIIAVMFGIDLATLRRLCQTGTYRCCRQEITEDYAILHSNETDSQRDDFHCDYVKADNEEMVTK